MTKKDAREAHIRKVPLGCRCSIEIRSAALLPGLAALPSQASEFVPVHVLDFFSYANHRIFFTRFLCAITFAELLSLAELQRRTGGAPFCREE